MPRVIEALAAAVIAIAAGSQAQAASRAPPTVAKLAGDWTIARTSEWPDDCPLTLKRGQTIGGFDLALKHGCREAFAWTADLTAWRLGPAGDLVLADALRHGVIHFVQGEDGDWMGPGPDGQDYIITRDRPAPVRHRRRP
jgi:hypothetical protein